MNNTKLILWSLTVALCGLLFGLDVAVISGAEQKIQSLWGLSPFFHGFVISIALYGTVLGAILGGYFADLLGRKLSLIGVGFLFLISAIGCAVAPEVYTFMISRFIGGFCIGVSSVISPLYISEIAPAKQRGGLVALFQFNIVFGILLAYFSNYFLEGVGGENSWRWMLGVVAVPSFFFMVCTFFISESPRWLILKKNNLESARKVLLEISPNEATNTFNSILGYQKKQLTQVKEAFFSKKYIWIIFITFLLGFFNQMSGINAIIYYAPRIFEMAGFQSSSALLSSVGVGVINLLFTMVGLSLIDKFGRRVLMYIGSIGYIISLSLIANCFYTEAFHNIAIYIFLFIASHAIGQGAVIWVFFSEIFPNSIRASGQSFGCFVHWIFAALIANVFPQVASFFGPASIFVFFTIMMVAQLLYVHFIMPETKGIVLEDMDTKIIH